MFEPMCQPAGGRRARAQAGPPMEGLARLVRMKRELDALHAFVEDIETVPGLLEAAAEVQLSPHDWINALRDMLCRADASSARTLFRRFITLEILGLGRWARLPLLTARVSWQSSVGPAKLKAWRATSGRPPPRMARLDYIESMVVHIGRVGGTTSSPTWEIGGWAHDGDWWITAASFSVAVPLNAGGECCSSGGLGLPDWPLLQSAAEQRLAWATAMASQPSAGSFSACRLSSDLIEYTAKWVPCRKEFRDRDAAVALAAAEAATSDRPGASDVPTESRSAIPAAGQPVILAPDSTTAVTNLTKRFPGISLDRVAAVLHAHNGHAGRAARALREAEPARQKIEANDSKLVFG